MPLPEHPVSTTDTSPTPPASPRNESGQNWLKSTQLSLPKDQRVQGSGLEKLVLSSIHFGSLCGSYGKLYNEETEREYICCKTCSYFANYTCQLISTSQCCLVPHEFGTVLYTSSTLQCYFLDIPAIAKLMPRPVWAQL